MIKAIDIANFFIDLSNSLEEELMTNLKVNKLVYLAQAWSFVRLGKPLFCENIQAWQYGPVIPSVYNTFKVCGANNIENVFGEYNQKIFSPEELDLLIDIAIQYGQYTASALVNITHKPGSPWSAVYEEHKHNIITNNSIKEYFSKLKPLPSSLINKENFVGYRDKEGYLVLPKEWNDGNA